MMLTVKMDTTGILEPCPVCGKQPKVKRDCDYESSGFGAWCVIQCKPLFRKPHLKAEQGKAQWHRAFKYAAIEWNEKAKRQCERMANNADKNGFDISP